MASKKTLVAVIGATGAQGGSVARALLADGTFAVRAVTRKSTADAAKALAAKGAEVVEASVDDVDTLKKAFTGAGAVFAVTNFWEHFNVEREVQQGKNIVDAAKVAGVGHLVISSLESVTKISGGKITNCGHFDSKAIIEEYALASGVPVTFVRLSYYYDNFISQAPRPDGNGGFVLVMPMDTKKMAGFAVEDTGGVVLTLLKNKAAWVGKAVGLAGDELTLADYVAQMSAATGKKITYQSVPTEAYAKFGFPGAEDVAAMYRFYQDFPPVRDVAQTKALYAGTQSFAQWLTKNKDALAAKLV